MTMYELCAECRNWFLREIIRGDFRVIDGVLQPVPDVPDGAWIRVVGSLKNDGVYRMPHGDFADEAFTGAVWLMAIPDDFVTLLDDITEWETATAKAVADASAQILAGPYTSESFGGYEYTRKTGLGDVPTSWRDPRLGFAAQVNRWRKI